MATRPTKELTLPDQSVVTLKTYLTVREEDEIQGVFVANADMKQSGRNLEVVGMKASAGRSARDKLLQIMVVSVRPAPVNGEVQALIEDPAQILEYLMEMPKNIYAPLEKEINNITDPKDS